MLDFINNYINVISQIQSEGNMLHFAAFIFFSIWIGLMGFIIAAALAVLGIGTVVQAIWFVAIKPILYVALIIYHYIHKNIKTINANSAAKLSLT